MTSRRLVAVFVLIISATARAESLKHVWNLRVSDVLGKGLVENGARITAVSFSPNTNQFAAIAGSASKQGLQYLLVGRATDPPSDTRYFEMNDAAGDPENFPPVVSWSGDGEAIAVSGHVYCMNGRRCAVSVARVGLVFSGRDQVAGIPLPWGGSSPSSQLLSFTSSCKLTANWDLPGNLTLTSASLDRHLVAMSDEGRPSGAVLVADPTTQQVLHRWPLRNSQNSIPLLADSGKSLCATDGTPRHGVERCWDVDSGKEIATTASWNIHWPVRTAARAKRAVLSEYGWRIYFEGWETELGSLKRRIVWDFGTGRQVAAWRPKYESYGGSNPEMKEPYKFAISPDGTMILEGGDGVLALSRIEQ